MKDCAPEFSGIISTKLRRATEARMRIRKVSSQVAWGERESEFRSAKWSAAMMVATFAALLVFCVTLSCSVQMPSKMTASMDWMKWTNAECDAVLYNSPWANALFPLSSASPEAQKRLKQVTQSYRIGIVQLRSALPVREALLRALQLEKHYDQMNLTQKRTFDQKHPSDMTSNPNDPIVLYVEHYGKSLGFGGHLPEERENEYPAQEAALKLLDGTLIMPIKTEALQDDSDSNRFAYYFPRIISGQTVVDLSGKTLTFVFGRVLVGGGRVRPVQDAKKFRVATGLNSAVFFDVAGLTHDGRLEY